MRLTTCLALLAASTSALFAATPSLVVGFNTLTPLQVYTTSGVFVGDFGPSGASAGAVQGGLMYIVQPNATGTSSTVTPYNGSGNKAGNSFTVSDGIGDAAAGSSGSLWLAGYDGVVYNVSTSGSVLSSFNSGYKHIGVASNGSTLYTTRGDATTGVDGIDVRNSSGTITTTMYVGYGPLYGIAYDSIDNALWAAGFGYVYEFTTSGALLHSYYVGGDSRTPNGAIHDGITVADLTTLSSGAAPAIPTFPPSNPGAAALLATLIGFAALLYIRRTRSMLWGIARPVVLPLFALAGSTLFASVTVTLTPAATTVPIGGTLNFSASATESTGSATFKYRFSVAPHGTSTFTILKDFYYVNTWSWTPMNTISAATPSFYEGSWDVEATAETLNGDIGSTIKTITVTPLATSTPVVTSTSNPLVALYSAPPCASGNLVRVRFKASGDTQWEVTPFMPCTTGRSLNFYVAGMRPSTQYSVQQDTYNGPYNTPGAPLSFTTGKVNDSAIPSFTITKSAQPPNSTGYPFVLKMGLPAPFAYDVNDNVVWYNPSFSLSNNGNGVRLVYGGTLLGQQDDPVASKAVCPPGGTGSGCGDNHYLREYDLAGNIIRETNWTVAMDEINVTRSAQGKFPVKLIWFSHDAIRLSNGYTATIATDEQIRNQGDGNGNVDVLGDIVIVFDQNMQVVWFWDSFDNLDIDRKALLNNTCAPGGGGCPAYFYNINPSTGKPYTIANDWTHMNSVWYTTDGNLMFSIRHQAWVVKVNYANGSGNGSIIWKLGPNGSFSLPSGVSSDVWFNYQHDAEFASNGLLTLFDNNDIGFGQSGEHSRGQAWSLDQTNLVATPVVSIDLGYYSGALGSAQIFPNGNYAFGAGYIVTSPGPPPKEESISFEFTPAGSIVFQDQIPTVIYRSWRIRDLYSFSPVE